VEPPAALRLREYLAAIHRVDADAESAQLGGERPVGRLRLPHVHHAHEQPPHAQLLPVVNPIECDVLLPIVAEGDDHGIIHGVLANERANIGRANNHLRHWSRRSSRWLVVIAGAAGVVRAHANEARRRLRP